MLSAFPQKVAIYCYEDDALAHRNPRHSGTCASTRKANVVGTVTLQAVYTLENLSTPFIQRQVAVWRLAHQSFKLDGAYIVWEVAGMEALDPTLSLESETFKGVVAGSLGASPLLWRLIPSIAEMMMRDPFVKYVVTPQSFATFVNVVPQSAGDGFNILQFWLQPPPAPRAIEWKERGWSGGLTMDQKCGHLSLNCALPSWATSSTLPQTQQR